MLGDKIAYYYYGKPVTMEEAITEHNLLFPSGSFVEFSGYWDTTQQNDLTSMHNIKKCSYCGRTYAATILGTCEGCGAVL